MNDKAVMIIDYLKDSIRDEANEDYLSEEEINFLLGLISDLEGLCDKFNSGVLGIDEFREKAIKAANNLIYHYERETNHEVQSYLRDILQSFDEALLDVDIDLGTNIDSMTITEAEEDSVGNKEFHQAIDLMDKFEGTLMDYEEGVLDKDTVAYKFDSLKYKVEQLKKDCGIEDRTFLNEKMRQFEEVLEDYNISSEDSNESEVFTEARETVTVRGKTYPVKDKSYLDGKLAGYGRETGLESIMTVKYKNGDTYKIYDSGFDNIGSAYACAVKVEESKEITESSQSPMIFKTGNIYKLTPTESYPYDHIEITGISWNDMIGQCTIQYKVIMRDGSVEEGQSEAKDLISTIRKNNQDKVEFYRTKVPNMNESKL